MNGPQAIQTALAATKDLMGMYLSDLSDADLLVRPVPGANHIAWQIGHVIASEVLLLTFVLPRARYPRLTEEFKRHHGDDVADGPEGFLTKAGYLELFGQVRGATIAAAGEVSEAELDEPMPGIRPRARARMDMGKVRYEELERLAESPLAEFAPTLGAFLLLLSDHTLMHAGQFTVVRRKLGKPVLF